MRTRSLAAALEDVRTARRWYLRERGRRPAEDFGRAYRETRAQIRRWPRSGQEVDSGIRRMLVEGFPYEVIYRVRGNFAEIVAVAHSSRQPGYWRDRTS